MKRLITLSALVGAAVLLATPLIVPARGSTDLATHCGIAPWTGTCACASGEQTMPYDQYARRLRAQRRDTPAVEAELALARRSCAINAED